MYLGSWKIDDLVTFTVNTHNPTTGAGADADSDPAYRVYEDETSTAILTGVMAKLDDANTVGYYSEQITLSAANGFEKGKSYNIYIAAAVGAVTGTMNQRLQIEAEVDANVVSDKTGYALSSAGLLAIWDVLTSTLDEVGSIGKLLVDNINTTISSRSSHSAADVWAVATRTLTAFNASFKTGYALSSAGVQDIWDALTSALTTVGSIGKLLVDNINTTISSRSSHSAADVWAVATRTLTSLAALLNISGGVVESNVKKINDTTITGDGSGTPWGPA